MDDATLPPAATAGSTANSVTVAEPAAAAGSPARKPATSRTRFTPGALADWFRRNPVDALLTIGCFAVVLGFFAFYKAFEGGYSSAFTWIWSAWNDENDFVHGKFSPIIIGGLLWLLRDKLWAARKTFHIWGIPVLGVGIMLYLLSVRMLQPRVAIGSLPIILTGISLILWGMPVTRLLLFPFFFIYLMVPIPSLEQMTASLQLVISSTVAALVAVFGVQIEAVGITLTAAGENGFTFEIAGGCSGVRSLMAMTMITALYVYFTQDALWKKLVIFGASLGFAVIGNIARVTSIILIAKLGAREFATGMWHDNASLIVFFPMALLSMVGFAKLVNMDWPVLWTKATNRDTPATAAASPTPGAGKNSGKNSGKPQDRY